MQIVTSIFTDTIAKVSQKYQQIYSISIMPCKNHTKAHRMLMNER